MHKVSTASRGLYSNTSNFSTRGVFAGDITSQVDSFKSGLAVEHERVSKNGYVGPLYKLTAPCPVRAPGWLAGATFPARFLTAEGDAAT